ncbi:MAG: SulP family inorganic anion transporter [Bacteroidia bacterium]|jgi:MFS superfamily sulfate permease-like transporter|nr:SulP family inorganic anion transporter [Bacteroidia bacterium]
MKSSALPLGSRLRADIPAGIVVFFVALPLCLGVALASGAPPFAGIVTGVVGGIITGILSGSQLGVSGPAAGLTTIVAAAVLAAGNWAQFVPAVILAGALQVLFGFLRAGIIAYYFPSSVIKGMLAAIGITIILKQFPHALGVDKDWVGDMAFWQDDGNNTFSEIGEALLAINDGALAICVAGILLMLLWETKFIKRIKVLTLIPGAMLAVLAGVLLVSVLPSMGSHFVLANDTSHNVIHFVNLPTPQSFSEFSGLFKLPDFSAFGHITVWKTAFVIALVASIETLLCLEATDKLDPEKRISPANRELKAQGIGNMVAGLLGGLPLTQVIVRSSANIQAGGKTKLATITHGIVLLSCAVLIPGLLNKIPNAALAAVLILVGYKLAKPSLMKSMYKAGWDQFIPFMVTILAILFTDLLVGIGIGLLTGTYFILRTNFKTPFKSHTQQTAGQAPESTIVLSENVSFLNKASIQRTLEHIPENAALTIDARNSTYIDYDVKEIIADFALKAHERKITFTFLPPINQPEFTLPETGHIKNLIDMRTHSKEELANLTPEQALAILTEGNKRFVNNLRFDHDHLQMVNETREGQYPFAIVLSCIDSRTSAEFIFDQGLGDIFSVRIAGNVLNDDIIGSMEFACSVMNSKLIVVLGHTDCGAIKGACGEYQLGHLSGLLGKARRAVYQARELKLVNENDRKFADHVAELNVRNVTEEILMRSPLLENLYNEGRIGIAGGMYNLASGEVNFVDTRMPKQKEATEKTKNKLSA